MLFSFCSGSIFCLYTAIVRFPGKIISYFILFRAPDKLSLPSMLKIGYIKLVKLNFTSLSTFSFHMVHCVFIGEHSYLYLYAGYHCYTSWQRVILFAVLPTIVLFPFSFGLALNLLKDHHITTNGFLLASVVPVYPIYLWVKVGRL